MIRCLLLSYFLSSLAALVLADGTRVEYLLSDFKNPGGIMKAGKKCDGSKRHCDTLITASIDTDSPTAAWPGYKPTRQWSKVFEADEKDSAIVNKIVSRDICNTGSGSRSFDRANLRVLVEDKDGDHNTVIEQFECLSGRDVARGRNQAEWSSITPCKGKFNPNKVKLNYKWRAYPISTSECGRPVNDDQPAWGRRSYYNN